MTELPVLFLDVDGVLSPVRDSAPPGYEVSLIDGARVIWSPMHGEWLASLLERFDIVWATTWESDANRTIGPALGLPELPVVAFGPHRSGDTWKLAAIAEFAGERPCAWADDRLFADADQWAANRSAATLLVRPMPSIGLAKEHFMKLVDFAEGLSVGGERQT